MKTIYAMIIFILFSGCGDSTGPSQVLRDQLVVIDTATGSVIETVNLTIGGNCETEISSDGNFLYILRNSHISRFDLNGMTMEEELYLPVSGTPLISSAISENDSLLFVVAAGLSPMLYKVTTADMTIADTMALGVYAPPIGIRPSTDLLYLGADNAQIFILDTEHMIYTDTLNIFFNSDILFSDSGDEMYLYSEGSLSAFNPNTGQVLRSQLFPGSIYSLEASRGSSSIFVLWGTFSSGNTLVELDRSTFSMKGTLENCYNSTFIRYIESLSRLFLYPTVDGVDVISVMDMPGFQTAGEVDVDEFVTEMVVSPTSDKLYCFIYYNSNPDVN